MMLAGGSNERRPSGLALELVGVFERDLDLVIATMLFPRDERLRVAYLLRKQIERSSDAAEERTLAPHEQRVVLDLPSRAELRDAADAGSKRGLAAGDLVAIMYDLQRSAKPCSMRAAMAIYGMWARRRKYADGEPLKYSDRQLKTFFAAAKPAAHLWGALRLLATMGKPRKAFSSPEEFGLFLGVAAEAQRFLTGHIPERTHSKQPTVSATELHILPSFIEPIAVDRLR